MPIIAATEEAEARESLKPGRQRLQRAKITPLNSSLGNLGMHHMHVSKHLIHPVNIYIYYLPTKLKDKDLRVYATQILRANGFNNKKTNIKLKQT